MIKRGKRKEIQTKEGNRQMGENYEATQQYNYAINERQKL